MGGTTIGRVDSRLGERGWDGCTANFLVNRRITSHSRCAGPEEVPISCSKFALRGLQRNARLGLGQRFQPHANQNERSANAA